MTSLLQTLLDTKLPLVPRLEEICQALDERGAVIVRSDPGSGKSTLVPLALMDHGEPGGRAGSGRILMLEPRRAAVLGIASRMAELLGEEAGGRVGYAVRLERKLSARTRIEVLTEGLFIRRIQANPNLSGVSAVIMDEFHERSLYTDLALAFILDLRRMGSKAALVIMSATMDADMIGARIAALSGGISPPPAVINCPGRVFPVDIHYRPRAAKKDLGRETADAVTEILQSRSETRGSVTNTLVFLPGRGEIEAAFSRLRELGLDASFEILPLHGNLPLERQRKVISQPTETRGTKARIILATNVAETGLTVPGVNLVVDSGYVRLERYHLPTGMNRLSLEPNSRQSADQRAGRAGRLMKGSCFRLWEESAPRSTETPYEINRVDLSGMVLECCIWGAPGREALPWLDPPPEAGWNRAVETLTLLGAIERAGTAALVSTPRGREMVRLGVEVPLAGLCIAGREAGKSALACAAAAILSERDGSGIREDADLGRRLGELRVRKSGPDPRGTDSYGLWRKRVKELTEDLLKRLEDPENSRKVNNRGEGGSTGVFSWTAEDEADLGEILAGAFPGRLAKRRDPDSALGETKNPRPNSGIFRFCSGREGRIEGPLKEAEWIVAVEVDAGERLGVIRLAAEVSKESALKLLETQITTETVIEWKDLIPRTVVTRRAGKILIAEERRQTLKEEATADISRLLRERGTAILPWDDTSGAALRFLERVRFFLSHDEKNDDLPVFFPDQSSNLTPEGAWNDAALIDSAGEWLGPFIGEGGGKAGPVITGASLLHALEGRFGWERLHVLNKEVPPVFTLPSGKGRAIDYSSGEPVLRLRLQDAFGIKDHPRIMGATILFHLLSPADRPVQVTADLPGFWSGSYQSVRKDMKGRYPKHPWPEDPA